MKKALLKKKSMAVVMVILVLNLSACGDKYAESPYLGKWIGTTAAYSGISMNVTDIIGGEFDFILEASGKCSVSIAGEVDKGKWEETDTGFIVVGEFEFVVDGDTALMNYDGVDMTFVKQ